MYQAERTRPLWARIRTLGFLIKKELQGFQTVASLQLRNFRSFGAGGIGTRDGCRAFRGSPAGNYVLRTAGRSRGTREPNLVLARRGRLALPFGGGHGVTALPDGCDKRDSHGDPMG